MCCYSREFSTFQVIYHWLNSKETHITLIACIKYVTNEEQYFTKERKKLYKKNCEKNGEKFQIQTIHAIQQRLEWQRKICKINDGKIPIARNLLKNITTIHYGICFDLFHRDSNISFCSRIESVVRISFTSSVHRHQVKDERA